MKKVLLFAIIGISMTTAKAQMAPTLVADVCNNCNSNTSNLFLRGSNLMFVAYDTTYGRELRSYDGTNPPSVIDVFTGTPSGTLADTTQELINYNDTIYFQGTLATGKSQLMKWDGINPASKIIDINSTGTARPDAFSRLGDKIYFAAWRDTAQIGDQIYELNPTNDNVARVTNHSHVAEFFITESVAFKNKLYFVTDRGSDFAIYVYDPATGMDAVAFPTFFTYYDPVDLTVIDTMLYFSAIETSHGRELFQYDGYADTPTMVTDVSPGIGEGVAASGIIEYNNKVYFFGNDQGSSFLFKLWYYDPATQQVNSLSSFNVGTHPDKKKMLAVYKNRLIIKAQDELAYSDGANVTTISTGDFNPTEALEFQDDLYMNGYTTANERALFKIDSSVFYLNVPNITLEGTAILYPNPADDIAYIKLTLNNTQSFSVQLIDLLGRTVYKQPNKYYAEGKHLISIPMQNMPNGTYKCVLQNKQGKPIWSGTLLHQ